MTRRHGVGKEGVVAILDQQGGGCAICGILYEDVPGRRLAMDHDHHHCPGKIGCARCVRGMLCSRGNNLVRLAGDDPAMFERAIAYLRAWHGRIPMTVVPRE